MYKVIIVGSDGSDRAAVAVREAIALAKMSGAKLHVVHVVRPVTMVGAEQLDAGASAATRASLHDYGDDLCKELLAEAEGQGVSGEAHVVEGHPADILIKLAEHIHADVVVVGNRGMTGIKRFVLGSIPNTVSHHCPCSLLIVNTETA